MSANRQALASLFSVPAWRPEFDPRCCSIIPSSERFRGCGRTPYHFGLAQNAHKRSLSFPRFAETSAARHFVRQLKLLE